MTTRTLTADAEHTPSLRRVFENHFLIGAAVNTWNLDESRPEYAMLRKQFGIFTTENEMKPENIHPEEGRWVFDRADRFVRFGEETGAVLRGHTLVWHGQCPDWFFTDASKEVLLRRMNDHITTLVSRYRGRIRTWDVVNEVLSDGGGMRESKWSKIAGTDYIKEAFRTAHAADPDARLIINDYNLESSDAKADTMVSFVREMLEEGVPVHGIGLQMHLSMDTDLERLKKNVRKLTALREIAPDLRLEVTELDLSCYSWTDQSDDIEQTPAFEAAFARKYADLFRFFLQLSSEGLLDTVVFWGLHDGVSWLNSFPRRHTNYPLLIGRGFCLKPAFFAVSSLAE